MEWKIGDVSVPAGTEADFTFNEPQFSYKAGNCGYIWSSFDIELIKKVNGQRLSKDNNEFLSLGTMDESSRTLTFHQQLTYHEITLFVTLAARLSDQTTQASTTFKVTF